MGDTPWKRTDWNDIIDRVNDLCTNPDSGCTGIHPLDDVEADHIWSVDDVQQVRDKLTEICSDNQFNADLRLWKQDIIDEINDGGLSEDVVTHAAHQMKQRQQSTRHRH